MRVVQWHLYTESAPTLKSTDNNNNKNYNDNHNVNVHTYWQQSINTYNCPNDHINNKENVRISVCHLTDQLNSRSQTERFSFLCKSWTQLLLTVNESINLFFPLSWCAKHQIRLFLFIEIDIKWSYKKKHQITTVAFITDVFLCWLFFFFKF